MFLLCVNAGSRESKWKDSSTVHGPFSYMDRQTVKRKGSVKRRSCPDGGWEGLVEERAEDVVTLAELETQSRGVSR